MLKWLWLSAIGLLLFVSGCSSCPLTRRDNSRLDPNPNNNAWQGQVQVQETLKKLLVQEDTNSDKRITVEDHTTPFVLEDLSGARHTIDGTYPLSVLLQELGLAIKGSKKTITLSSEIVFENAVARTERMIRDVFWDGLTRRIDRVGLPVTLPDPKMPTIDGFRYLYIPASDPRAFAFFSKLQSDDASLHMKVVKLPKHVDEPYLNSVDGRQGLLMLATHSGANGELLGVPFVVPGGRFNVMYGWDSYFITLGLLQDGKIDLARSMVDNHVYEVEHYGMVLNGNRTYYIMRAQPPFLTSMALAVYAKLPKTPQNRAWLKKALWTEIKEYRGHWMKAPRLDTATGLSRYWGEGKGPCPEVHQPKLYEPVLKPRAEKFGLSIDDYLAKFMTGKIKDAFLDKWFLDDRALRESGHDRSYRFDDRTSDFLTVDLNSLLYKIETDLASAIETEFGGTMSGEHAADWHKRAAARKEAMNKLLWDEKAGQFFDYDTSAQKRSQYVSATAFYPLWAGLASPDQARRTYESTKPMLIQKCGLASTAEASRGPITAEHPKRQWDFPNGWAPHQMLAWVGLANYGMKAEMQDLAYRWLYGITKNVREFNGAVPEKLDVQDCSQQMRAGSEFDNVGTEFKYAPHEGFGWMNASYQIGLRLLSNSQLTALKELKQP